MISYASTSILQCSSSTKTMRSPTFLVKIGEVYRNFRLITGFKTHVFRMKEYIPCYIS